MCAANSSSETQSQPPPPPVEEREESSKLPPRSENNTAEITSTEDDDAAAEPIMTVKSLLENDDHDDDDDDISAESRTSSASSHNGKKGMFQSAAAGLNCSETPVCQFAEHLEHFTDLAGLAHLQCQYPLDFLSHFQEQRQGGGAAVDVHYYPAGMYTIPKSCEYCGSESTDHCNPSTCQRPQSFFRKQRPPFCQPNQAEWDASTDYPKQKDGVVVTAAAKAAAVSSSVAASSSSPEPKWGGFSGFFGGAE